MKGEKMFRIRRIFDDAVPANQHTLGQVKAIMRSHFEVLACKKKRMPVKEHI